MCRKWVACCAVLSILSEIQLYPASTSLQSVLQVRVECATPLPPSTHYACMQLCCVARPPVGYPPEAKAFGSPILSPLSVSLKVLALAQEADAGFTLAEYEQVLRVAVLWGKLALVLAGGGSLFLSCVLSTPPYPFPHPPVRLVAALCPSVEHDALVHSRRCALTSALRHHHPGAALCFGSSHLAARLIHTRPLLLSRCAASQTPQSATLCLKA